MTDQNPNGTAIATQSPTANGPDPRVERAIALREGIRADATPGAIVPRSFAEVQSFAGALAASSLVPKALQDRAPDVMVILLGGLELGFAPMASLRNFNVIEGVPKLNADGLAALVTASSLCEYLELKTQTSTSTTWIAKRRGRPEQSATWTIADAELAGLVRKNRDGSPGNWMKYPKQMMTARCRSELARRVWPDLCAGLDTSEEFEDRLELAPVGGVPGGFTAPVAPPIQGTVSPPVEPARRGPGRPPKSAPIDVAGTETRSVLPPDPAREDAFARARENTRVADAARAERGAEVAAAPDPTIGSSAPPSASSNAPEPATSAPAATSSSSTAASSSPASDAGDGFGDDEAPAATEEPRTLERFEREVRAMVERSPKGAAGLAALDTIKGAWVEWSKADGKPHAHRMREIFAKAKADLS